MKHSPFLFLLFALLSLQGMAQIDQISLNGKWEIIFDEKDEGVEGKWYLNNNFETHSAIRQIDVPSCWEEYEMNYEGVAFYRKKFFVPAEWKDKIIYLNFDAVNYVAECWFNNHVVDYHEGGFTPFSFRIDKLLKFGEENILTMRVVGPIILTDKRIDNMGRQETPQWRGGISGGIWQPVSITATGAVRINDVFIETDIHRKTASFTINLESNTVNSSEAELSLNIASPDGNIVTKKTANMSLAPGKNEASWVLDLPDVQLWSPENPYLYRAKIEVKYDGAVSDVWKHKFGMREFTIRNERFVLNNKPIYLKATFFEGLYPVRIGYPDSREMAVREIELAKEAGFNMIRPWRKPPPKMWLDLCDSIGMLTVGSNVVECMHRPVSTPYLAERVETEIRESIMRDRNRTCVVQWELFNEANRPVLQQMMHSMSVMAQDLDPGRLILDESGGTKGANFYLPHTANPMRFNDIHTYPGGQVTREQYDRLLMIGKTKEEREALGLGHLSVPGRNVQPNLMSFLSELGYASWPDLVENNKEFREHGNPLAPAAVTHQKLEQQAREAFKITGFNSAFPNLEDYCRAEQKIHGIANKRMIEATRANPTISGYCVHALTDGDWILGASLVDLWRNPKAYVYDMTKAANQPQIVSIRILPRTMYAEKGGRIEVTGINELESVNATVHLNIVDADGEIISSKSFEKNFQQGVSALFNEEIETAGMKGNYTLQVTLEDEYGNLLTQNERSFDIFAKDQLVKPKIKVAVLDNGERITAFLEDNGVEQIPFSTDIDLSVPVLVGSGKKGDQDFLNKIDEVKAFVDRGGFAVFLEVSGTQLTWGAPSPEPRPKDAGDDWRPMVHRVLQDMDVDKLPFSANMYATTGNYISRNHIVTDHAVFKGLPVNTLMSGIYENICADESICRPAKGKYLAGVITYDQQKNMDIMLRHYNGIGDVLWAADLLEVDRGNGKMLFSTLKLVPNLGKDPVADKLLYNMIELGLN
ncbi:glycoside hydrolase family 2 protein [Maribellus sediminis]|uniref:glycoside hydrolase family 2 protein n=1 Tax=Maribellus sediminis TaxID=2696285 RepID=UPI00142FD7FD|nr:sugar-binding domain-containing protein [Maribellus sediminis]